MDSNHDWAVTNQPLLFDLGDSSETIELFPAAWRAAESITSNQCEVRRAGLEQLRELGVTRVSPLIAYTVATRIADEDLEFRAQVIHTLGEIFARDERGMLAPEQVRTHLKAYLASLRTRPIYAILEAANADPSLETPIVRLLNMCSYAGNHLADIMNDRKAPLDIRRKAVEFIGKVGYLSAVSGLERLKERLEARQKNQEFMAFAPPTEEDELCLLAVVKTSLAQLQAP